MALISKKRPYIHIQPFAVSVCCLHRKQHETNARSISINILFSISACRGLRFFKFYIISDLRYRLNERICNLQAFLNLNGVILISLVIKIKMLFLMTDFSKCWWMVNWKTWWYKGNRGNGCQLYTSTIQQSPLLPVTSSGRR